jgi:hypothetical protein
MSFLKISIITIVVSLLAFLNCNSQTFNPTIVRGLVTDSISNDPLPSVYVMYMDSSVATITDDEGLFTLHTQDTISYLKVRFVGHQTKIIHVTPGANQFVNITLKPISQQLSEVVIKAKRKRYRNADNPAVAIIEEVIRHKLQNHTGSYNDLAYNKYQKVLFALDHVSPKLVKIGLMKPFRFVFDNVDTTIIPGKRVLPVYLQEIFATDYFRKQPPASKEIVSAEKLVNFDEYVDRKSLDVSISYLYHNIDIYSNIDLLGNQFLSPIAPIAPSFYKYFINDTVVIDSAKCIRLTFAPRNKRDFLFQGYIYITYDTLFAVKKIKMQINKEINLNWVKSVAVDQEFRKIGQEWMLSLNELTIDFGITKNSLGLYGQRIVLYNNYKLNVPANDSIFNEAPNSADEDSLARNEAFWRQNRPLKLSPSERNVYAYMDSLQSLRSFKRDMDIIRILTLGYKKVGPVEFGPITTLYSQNPVEGSRTRLGVRTTDKFTDKLFLEIYGAYGFKDQKFKSYGNAVYALNNKSIRDFPQKSIGISFLNDMKIPGEELQFVQSDNFLLSFKRNLNDKMYYYKTYRIEHLNEFPNHFSYNLGYEYYKLIPAGHLYFNTNSYADYINDVGHLNVGQLSLDLRYAPHEKFVLGSLYRALFASKYPVLEVKILAGTQWLGSDYDFQNVRASISKRFNLFLLGYTDIALEGGKIFGHVPFPLLDIHRANESYSYQKLSYNLMNFLEFVSDQYASLNVDHNFNGLIFNRIPLIKKLKFRESVTFKLLTGSLSNTNNPLYRPDLFKFPTDQSGNPLTYSFGKEPYMELGFGITNIFKFFRIDYVMRLSYLDHPGISKSGILFDYKFDF